MDEDSQTWGVALFIIFIVINFIMYAFYSAIQNLSGDDIEHLENEETKKSKNVLKIVNNQNKLINTLQLTSLLMAMIVGFFELNQFGSIFYAKIVSVASGFLTTTFMKVIAYAGVGIYLVFIMLALGCLLPRCLASRDSIKWINVLLMPNRIIMWALTPITVLINFLTFLILKVLGIELDMRHGNVTERTIISMVAEGHEQGILEASDAEMIANIFEWGDKQAEDIMTHRKNIKAISGDLILAEVADILLASSYSRFPVYDKDIDNIIGILNFRDAMIVDDRETMENKRIKDIPYLLRKAYMIPETRNIDDLFKDMQSQKVHMTVVIDEYGQTSGIVTMEDILEEIVGNILDEYDEEEHNIIKNGEKSYIVKGMTPLEDISELTGIDFEEDDYDTINGYLISKLGRIPSEDDKSEINIENVSYKVLEVENKMISLLEINISQDIEDETEIEENEKE